MSEEENLVSYDSNADELDYLGTIQTSIVGLQYYDGHVQPYEMVILEREQNNVYDHWAIRVDNVRGQRVGHLPRTLVAHLSPLVDAGRWSWRLQCITVSTTRTRCPSSSIAMAMNLTGTQLRELSIEPLIVSHVGLLVSDSTVVRTLLVHAVHAPLWSLLCGLLMCDVFRQQRFHSG